MNNNNKDETRIHNHTTINTRNRQNKSEAANMFTR